MAEIPERPKKPSPPPAGKLPAGKLPSGKVAPSEAGATPPPEKPVVKAVAKPPIPKAKRSAPEPVPVGKLVTPASVAPPPAAPPSIGPASFPSGVASHSGAFRARRRGTPAAVWAVVGLGVVGAGVLGVFLVLQGQKDETADRSEKHASKSSAKKDHTASNDDQPREKPSYKQDASKADPGDKKTAKQPDAAANDKPSDKPASKPSDKPSPAPADPATPVQPSPAVAVKQFRGIEEVPLGDRPAAVDNLINDCVALLDAGKFDEFFQAHVDPRDRGAPPPAIGRRGRNDSPYDVLAQGTEKIGRILAGIGNRQPHVFEDGKIVVFDLAWRTRPTFVEHEGRWYLSRGVATSMERRFVGMSDQEELIYLLEIAHGKPAVAPDAGQRDGAELGAIEQLVQMGAIVALSHPDEEYRRAAVMLTDKFKGGDAGLELLGQLNDRSQITVLVVDGMSGSNITEEIGLMEFDNLTHVEYLRFTNTPVQRHPVTVHFQEMSKLKTLILDGGSQVGDVQISDHLRTCAELKRLSLKGDLIADSTLERLKKFSLLEALELNVPSGSVTAGAVKGLRDAVPGLWVDY